MAAGEIHLKLPDPGISAGLAGIRKVRQEVRALKAIEQAAARAARRAAASGRLVNALSSGLKLGVTGGSLAGLAGGSPHVMAVRAAAAVLARVGAVVMAQQDIPEVARLSAVLSRATETATAKLFTTTSRFEDLVHAMTSAVRRPIDETMARLQLIALGKVRNMMTTAFLERGGTRVEGALGRGFTLDGGGIVSLPGSATFTEPQNVIVEDFKGVTPLEEDTALLEILAEQENRRAAETALEGARDVMARVTATAREAVDGAMKATTQQLERAGAAATRGAPPADLIESSLSRSLLATEELNEALALDAELLDQIGASHGRAAGAQRAHKFAMIAATVAVRAAVAIAKGVAEAAALDWVSATAHFTAAGLYATAGALAGVSVARPPGRDERDGDGRRRSFAREAELVVMAPGYTDVEGLQRLIVQAVNADVPTSGREVIEVPRMRDPGVVELLGFENHVDFYDDLAHTRLGSAWRRHPLRGLFRAVGHFLEKKVHPDTLRLGKAVERIMRGQRKRAEREVKRTRKRVSKEWGRAKRKVKKVAKKLGF